MQFHLCFRTSPKAREELPLTRTTLEVSSWPEMGKCCKSRGGGGRPGPQALASLQAGEKVLLLPPHGPPLPRAAMGALAQGPLCPPSDGEGWCALQG